MNKKTLILLNLLTAIGIASAQSQEATIGQPTKIKVLVKEAENAVKCNVDVFIEGEGGGSFQRTIEPPNLEFAFDYTPSKVGTQIIRWEGRFKRAGLNSLTACPGNGVIQVLVKEKNELKVQTSNNNHKPNPSDWKSMGSDNSRQIFYSPSSIQGAVNERRMFMKINVLGDSRDGAKSRVLEYLMNCSDKSYIFESLKTYSEIDLGGAERFIHRPNGGEKKTAQPNTLANQWLEIACNNITSPTTAATTPSIRENNFKYVSKLPGKEINTQILKKLYSETQIGIFLQTYAFIWNANEFVNSEHNEVSTWWHDTGQYWHQNILPYKENINKSFNSLERTIEILSKNLGITPIQFKEAIGIFEYVKKDFRESCSRKTRGEWRDNFGRDCDPPSKNLKTLKAGTVDENVDRNRDDITSNGISEGFQFFHNYISENNLRKHNFEEKSMSKKDDRHPGIEMHPRIFFDYYARWFPDFFADQMSLNSLGQYASAVESRMAKAAQERESLLAQKAEEERKRQEFLRSPAGQKQIAAEKEAERQRQNQYAKEYPYYAEITCNNGGYGNFQIHACFTSSRSVLFELKNGSEYKFYTLPDIMELAAHSGGNNESIINLRNNFQLKMQNAGEQWILGLRVIKRTTGEVMYQKKVSGYGVISVKN